MPNPTPTVFMPYHALDNVIMRGTRASQALASAVTPGALYCVTDESNKVERSSGTVWEAYSPAASTATGDVVGPASSTDLCVAFFSGTTGKLLRATGMDTLPVNASFFGNTFAYTNSANNFTTRQVITAGGSPTPDYCLELRGSPALSGDHPGIIFNNTGAAADAKKFRIVNYQGLLRFDALNDAETAAPQVLSMDRVGNVTVHGSLGVNVNVSVGAGTVTANVLTSNANTNVYGNLHTQGAIYPGRADVAATQGGWYLQSHGSYGLWTNTGFYATSNVWAAAIVASGAVSCNSVECTAHIRWGGQGSGPYWSWDGVTAFLQSTGRISLIAATNARIYLTHSMGQGGVQIGTLAGGPIVLHDDTDRLRFDSTHAPGHNYYMSFSGNGIPNAFFALPDNTKALGTAGFRYTAVYAVNGAIQTSDALMKTDITDNPLGLAFVEQLKPKAFTYTDDPTPGRIGFLTQDVEAALEGRPFAALQKTETGRSGLNYAGFVPILTSAIQELSARLKTLEEQRG